jgi:putative tryptophan/tyrosine transport system substrate-binding protein
MRRREFIGILSGVAAAMPFGAHGQQAGVPTIGFVSSRSPEDSAPHVAGFLRGLEEAGYVRGQTVAIEYRWAEGHYERLPELMAEVVALRVAALAAPGGTPSALAAKAATATIPILFVAGDDPVRAGLVESFSRPGGNVTGVSLISSDLGAKRLELLLEMVPSAKEIALLLNPSNPDTEPHRQVVEAAAEARGCRLLILRASNETEFDANFALLGPERISALLVQNDPFFDSRRERLVTLTRDYAIPAIFHIREFPVAGALMSYGASLVDAYYQMGLQMGRILKGTSPRDLPVVRPTRFELVINMKAANTLGLSVPQSILARADEVIE